ncbi:hypothetical protein SELMODRAFT_267887 [Selaginella moellendorffii]|uniref:Protein arginine N-methyltransferase PRMT10 n=1 Tax=Selaginella moellendorffii TaxID=88036 RepID=D8RXA7_SELML|nr:protein arginine N-methyltransferase PRMT10 [Selaginella moellendorffii]XP_002994552.1 protein arginine N-methyltransferase PRMT10 [Selaginella moellendorffii]EFJ04382.1 hypothetical protein SELMODRAFT_236988 [Selaginella moellendorffii]EFJ23225.1 hypothetical protein SELMODRAFT_267887 [Selaginella moellendorffii]|eukprot:XP_002975596.1 protein arginine N-methyltransferase PRMT10 [Selaginella moellendorffii]
MESARGGAPVDKAVDFANYFCTYSYLYHQKDMLSDRVRMDAYHSAVFKNKRHFQGKTVLDVGTGSGILAIWSAQAGAKKVYAVEATNMARHARSLASANGVSHIVEVIEGSIEDVSIPEKVDVIISEWMGYFLVRESMFDSVIYARDRWLKPSGLMYPSHARMWFAPIKTKLVEQKNQEYQKSLADWSYFAQELNEAYGVDMSTLTMPYHEEQKKYYLQTSLWSNLYPGQVIGDPVVVKEIDCSNATLQDIAAVKSRFSFTLSGSDRLCGFAGWFDVHFRGNASNPADKEVELTTSPSDTDTTHWGQQVFLLQPPLVIEDGDVVQGSIEITRSKDNHRLMDVKITHELRSSGEQFYPATVCNFFIE